MSIEQRCASDDVNDDDDDDDELTAFSITISISCSSSQSPAQLSVSQIAADDTLHLQAYSHAVAGRLQQQRTVDQRPSNFSGCHLSRPALQST